MALAANPATINEFPGAGQAPSSHSQLSHSSPLESLVSRTSPIQVHSSYSNSKNLNLQPNGSHLSYSRTQMSPASPLLHSHFARSSTATASSLGDNSFLNSTRSSVGSTVRNTRDTYTYPYAFDDIASAPSEEPALRESWQSVEAWGSDRNREDEVGAGEQRPDSWVTVKEEREPSLVGRRQQSVHPMVIHPESMMDTIREESASPGSPPLASQHPLSPVPLLVISSPGPEALLPMRAGRAPVVASVVDNFSRPARSSNMTPDISPPFVHVDPAELNSRKRLVLERNASRVRSSSAGNHSYPVADARAPPPTEPLPPIPIAESRGGTSLGAQHPVGLSFHSKAAQRAPTDNIALSAGDRVQRRSTSRSPSPSSTLSTNQSSHLRSVSSPSILDAALPASSERIPRKPQDVVLPRHPPTIPLSPTSLYSRYSYYPLDSPSPTSDLTLNPPHPSTSMHSSPNPKTSPQDKPPTAADYLQLGIQHHEANRLKESAECFERSAKEGGGCGVGKLMWGLALRHGWGCAKNEQVGFTWLSRAAASAVDDLENARLEGTVDVNAVQNELVLAIYEVGQCFFHGWGVAKDQKMGVSYYAVAARLGDPDAQQDLAFCLANGKGCKKNRKDAAKWYRAAVAQGVSDVGLAWIYKEKYQ